MQYILHYKFMVTLQKDPKAAETNQATHHTGFVIIMNLKELRFLTESEVFLYFVS